MIIELTFYSSLQGQVSIPGTIGSYMVERSGDIEEEFDHCAPVVIHFGHTNPAKNLTLYNLVVSRMADIVNMKCGENEKGE